MSEHSTLWQLFQVYRVELGYSFVSAAVAVFRHWQLKHPFRDIVTGGALCAFVAFGMNHILSFFNIDHGTWGYLASVFLGYIGVETALDWASEKIPFLKKIRATPAHTTNPEDPTDGKV